MFLHHLLRWKMRIPTAFLVLLTCEGWEQVASEPIDFEEIDNMLKTWNKGLLKDGCNVVLLPCYAFLPCNVNHQHAADTNLPYFFIWQSVVIVWWHSRNVPKITITTLYLGKFFLIFVEPATVAAVSRWTWLMIQSGRGLFSTLFSIPSCRATRNWWERRTSGSP